MTSTRKKLADLLGSAEGQQLEFKGAASVDDDFILPRSVCSFLNSGGGTIVVGVRDDGTPEGVADAGTAKRRIEDRLVSAISPHRRVEIEVQKLASPAVSVIRITVPEGESGVLYAVRSTKGRLLVPMRQGDRTVPLDWLDIVGRIASARRAKPVEPSSEAVRDALVGWEQRCEKDSSILRESGGLYLLLRVELSSPIAGLIERLEAVLNDESRVGVGYGEGGFSVGNGEVRVVRGSFQSGFVTEGYRRLEIATAESWELRFATRLDETWAWGQSLEALRTSRMLHPYALSQTVSACAALGAHLIQGHEHRAARVSGALELRRLRGRMLPPGPPGHFGYVEMPNWKPITEDPGPVVRTQPVADFVERPHTLAKLLLDALYESFGWTSSQVPFYDAALSKFVYR